MAATEEHLEARFKECQTTLHTFFPSSSEHNTLHADIHAVHAYYEHRFYMKEVEAAQKIELLEEYELFVSSIQGVQDGSLTAEAALQNIERISSARKWGIDYQNMLNTCALLFWLTVSVTSFVLCLTYGVPLMIISPASGLVFILGAGVTVQQGAQQIQENLRQYKSHDPINQQALREKNIHALFSSQKGAVELINRSYESSEIIILHAAI